MHVGSNLYFVVNCNCIMFVGVSSVELNFLKAVFKKFGGALSCSTRSLYSQSKLSTILSV